MALSLDFVRQLASHIDSNPCMDFSARVEVLHPLLDKLYYSEDLLSIQLDSGLRLKSFYNSRIAKEILLRSRENPTHAWEPMTTRLVKHSLKFRPGNVLIGGAYFGDMH